MQWRFCIADKAIHEQLVFKKVSMKRKEEKEKRNWEGVNGFILVSRDRSSTLKTGWNINSSGQQGLCLLCLLLFDTCEFSGEF